jgi:hypothetical protein
MVRNNSQPVIENELDVPDGVIKVSDDTGHQIKEIGPIDNQGPFFEGPDPDSALELEKLAGLAQHSPPLTVFPATRV